MNQTKYYYENFYTHSDWKGSYFQRKLLIKIFLKIIKTITSKDINTILDVGCGTGYYTKIFKDLGYDCEGFDFAKNAINKAKKQFPNCHFSCQEAKNLSYKKNFDLIFVYGFSLLNTNDFVSIYNILDYWETFLTKKGVIFIISKTNFSQISPTGWILHSEEEINKMYLHDDFNKKIYYLSSKLRYLLLFSSNQDFLQILSIISKHFYIKMLKKICPFIVILEMKK